MKKATAAEQAFDNIRIVSWTDNTIRHTHILHLTPKYQETLESGLSGKALVDALRKDNAVIYHDLTKDEARSLQRRGAQIEIPDDEFNTVPSIRGVSTVTGVETSRAHWQQTPDGKSCTPFDPAKYDPARPERVTAAVQYRNEQTGQLERRCYFPAGRLNNPAPGTAADAKIKNGFEYEQYQYVDGAAQDIVPDSLRQIYKQYAKMSAAELDSIIPAEATFDPETKNPVSKRYKLAGALHDLVGCRKKRKDGTLEKLPIETFGNRMPAVQKFDRLTGKLTAATSFNLFTDESALDQAEIDAFNKVRENGGNVRSISDAVKIDTVTRVGHYL